MASKSKQSKTKQPNRAQALATQASTPQSPVKQPPPIAKAQPAHISQPTFARTRTLPQYLIVLLQGASMGSADVVPGVSGGTIAFLMGIYHELVESIRMVAQPTFLRALLSFRILQALRLVNFSFLVWLLAGIGLAVVTLAPGIEWMLVNQPVLLWSFFFGLVAASVVTVGRRIEHWTVGIVAGLALGAIGAFWIVGLVPVQTPTDPWFLFVSGAIAICAMILPGISGSFILVLLGKYQYLVSALNNRDLVPLFWTALGCAVGIVSFAQLLSWLFRRFPNITIAVLTGFMLGSLRKVWPWKEVVSYITGRHGEIIPTVERNILPALTANGAPNLEVVYAVVLALIGFAVVFTIDSLANRKAPAAAKQPGAVPAV